MPKTTMTFDLPVAPADALAMTRRLVTERGLQVRSVTDGRLVCRRGWRATAWPITVELLFADGAGGGTAVDLHGKIGGVGPIQRRALTREVDELRESMTFEGDAGSRVPPR
jgi:hypothetical protein